MRAYNFCLYILLKIQDNLTLFQVDPSSAEWRSYVEYIDEMVIDGFYNSIECSLRFFLDNTGMLCFANQNA